MVSVRRGVAELFPAVTSIRFVVGDQAGSSYGGIADDEDRL